MGNTRKYQFNWDNSIGVDIHHARPNLGPKTRIEVYRLFQFTLRDVLEEQYGTQAADDLFRKAGIIAGRTFYEKFLSEANDVASLVSKIQETFNLLGMGIFRVEKAEDDNSLFIFTVDEDLDCSGLPDKDDVVCIYDEGFIKGLLDAFSGKNFNVKEVDCWCTNARTCRFEAKVE